jgi:hypothetical protein
MIKRFKNKENTRFIGSGYYAKNYQTKDAEKGRHKIG